MRLFNKVIEKLYLKQEGNLAYYDSLTNTHNRLYYNLELKPKYCTREAYVLFVDIDNLHYINNYYSHSEGDRVIKGVAEDLKRLGAEELSRIGGDEFVAIFPPNTSYKELNLFMIENASVGLYRKGKFEDLSSAVAKADEAMLIQKSVKKGGVCNEIER